MNRLRTIRNVTIAGFVAGLSYSLLTDDLSQVAPLLNAITIGTLGGFLASVMELYIFRPRVTRKSFFLVLGVRIIAYFLLLSILIILIKGSIDSYFAGLTMYGYFQSEIFNEFLWNGEFEKILLFSLFIIVLIIFTLQVDKYLGKNVLFNFVSGKYHSAREEERIILLIDLRGSTSMAEKLSGENYYRLLNRFFFDVFISIRPFRGNIIRYVGDQVTIIWPVAQRGINARCIKAFFRIREEVNKQRQVYESQFGIFPEFHGTAHVGTVVTGEIGDVRSQIVYQGKPLYQLGKMEKSSVRGNNAFCISGDLLEMIDMPEIYHAVSIGQLETESQFTGNNNGEFLLYDVCENDEPILSHVH